MVFYMFRRCFLLVPFFFVFLFLIHDGNPKFEHDFSVRKTAFWKGSFSDLENHHC